MSTKKLTTTSSELAALIWNHGWYGAIVSPVGVRAHGQPDGTPGALYEVRLETPQTVSGFTPVDGAPAASWGAREELEIVRPLPWPFEKAVILLPWSAPASLSPASYCAGFLAGLAGLKGEPPGFVTDWDAWHLGNTVGSERRQAEEREAGR